MIDFRDVSKAFRSGNDVFWAVDNVNLSVERGSFVSVVGPSGCGKSTLLNMVAGLDQPSIGSVWYEGARVRPVNTKVGYVTQHDNLLPWRTVRQNIALPLEIHGTSRAVRKSRVNELLEQMGLVGFGRHLPRELSGGMRKRTSIARTLAYGPQTLLMDEPFAALDAQLRLLFQEELLRLWSSSGLTIIFVTHDLAEAIALSDRVVMMSSRPGTILAAEEINFPRPRNLESLAVEPEFQQIHSRLWAKLRPELSTTG
jgi:NitT/TauT family transport system ATP-binding protein